MKTTLTKRVKTPQELLTTACYEVIYLIRDLDKPESIANATKKAKSIFKLLQTVASASKWPATEGRG